MSTHYPKSEEIERKWYVIDATDLVLGRLAVTAAGLLRGKGKPVFTPNTDCGDYVIIINADKVRVTSNKLDREFRYRHSGYPGGLKTIALRRYLEDHPERVVYDAIKGMMPHTKLSRTSLKKLRVYAGSEHPHATHNPVPYEVKQVAQ